MDRIWHQFEIASLFEIARMSRAGLVGLLALVSALSFSCSSSGPDEGGAPPRRFLSVGTAPPGGAFFVVGGALAEVLNAQEGAGWEVTAEATKGSQENIRRLDRGELDIALSNAAITYFAVRGEQGWDRAYDVLSVMTLAPNVAMFVTPRGSGIETIADLKGKRVVVGPAGAGMEYFIKPLLAAHGVSYDEFTPLNNTQTAAVDMLADGSAAAAFLGGAVPTASIVQASTSQDILLIPFSEEGKRRALAYPFFNEHSIPAGTYRGQEEDYLGLNTGSMHLITSASADEELIYQITKAIFENRAGVTEKHPAGQFINAENVVRHTGVDFHPGAIRYYQEAGLWHSNAGSSESQ